MIANIRFADGAFEIEANEDQPVWINGIRIDTQNLRHRDIIEFGETGPLSRFRLYGSSLSDRKMVSEILRDGIGYLRASRQPLSVRLYRGVAALLKRLTRETTLFFRVSVVLAIIALAMFAYQQKRMHVALQQQIERSVSQLESFAKVLARTRLEALKPSDLKALRQELGSRLSENAERLASLERRTEANARVISQSAPSVLFIQGAYGFREHSSGRMLRHIADDDGQLLIMPTGQPLLSLEGDGPVADRPFTGTGFAVGDAGGIITNRHVALPWKNDANVEALADQGLEPVMTRFIVYVPGKKAAIPIELALASTDADLAVLRMNDPSEPIPGLPLAEALPTSGDEIIVMGYPTGLRSMLAQAGADFIEELQKAEDIEFWSVATRLAEKGHIMPLASRGIVSHASTETVVYDAETTHGGSGGPVLDVNGSVVAVTNAIFPEYGGSNLGVPVAKVRALLEQAGLR